MMGTRGKRCGWVVKSKRGQLMVMKDLTLGRKHRIQYTDDVPYNCTLET